MRHNRDEKRFDKTYSHLKSMMSNMTNDLIMAGRIKTTTPRAKVLRSWAEKMITLGKNGSVASRRRAMAFLRNKSSVTRLFAEVAPQFKERNGGYTRILKLGNRPGDNAAMSIIELVEGAGAQAEAVAPKAAKAKKAPAKPKAAPKAKAEKTEKAEKAPRKVSAKKETAEKTDEKKAPAKKTKKEANPKE